MKKTIQLKGKDIAPLRDKILQEDQDGKCLICGKKPKRPCLDHSHIKKIKGTGKIRGVLCSTCNVFIGKSENNCMRYGISQNDLPDILRATAKYLEKEHYPFIHPVEAPKAPIIQKSSYNKLLKELKKIKYKNKIPVYRVQINKITKKEKAVQKLTKPLKKLYDLVNLEPTFYGG